jgi:hypothetical protein
VLSRDEVIAKIKDQGQQRAAMSTCMTCWGTASRHDTWAGKPSSVLARDVYARDGSDLLDRELRALALLVEAHPDEFADTMESLGLATPFRAQQAKRRLA